jgi:hypothetical protein
MTLFRLTATLSVTALCFGQIEIDRDGPVSGKELRVRNGARVTVMLINQSPFDTCQAEKKREELPEPSVVPSLLSLVSAAAGALTLFRIEQAPSGAPAGTRAETLGDQIDAHLGALNREVEAQKRLLDELQRDYQTEAGDLGAFFRTPYRNGKYEDSDFEADREAREKKISGLMGRSLVPTVAGGEASYAAVLRLFDRSQGSSAAWEAQMAAYTRQISLARSNLDCLKEAIGKLLEARSKLAVTLDYLQVLKKPRWGTEVKLNADSNAKISGSFSCVDTQTQKPTLEPVVFTVIYQDPPRLSLSAGVMVSSIEKNRIDQSPVVASRDGPSLKTELRLTESPSRPQVLPLFSLIQVRLGNTWNWRGREMSFNLTPGVGVNPNNAGNEGEFFSGASLGVGSLYLSAGAHIGHRLKPDGGFRIGDVLAEEVTNLPLRKPWCAGFGFAVTYRIPLK